MNIFRIIAGAILMLLAITASAQTVPANDACAGAIDISASFGHAPGVVSNTGPYDNTYATHHYTDPVNGFECFGEPNGAGTAPTLDNTLWFTFVGDGSLYFIETGQCNPPVPSADMITDGDTQFAIYKGSCGYLTPVACNEDGPSALNYYYPAGIVFRPEAGVTYYLMVDGFNYMGAKSIGKFCLLISKMPDVTCSDPEVSAGTLTVSNNMVCPGQTIIFSSAGVTAPNTGDFFGVSWVISNTDLGNSFTNMTLQGAVVATYRFLSPAPETAILTFTNDSLFIGSSQVPFGTYYWTPVVFGMATGPHGAHFLSELTLDPACTFIGQSVAVTIMPQNHPACSAVSNVADGILPAFSIGSMYPVPAQNQLTLSVNALKNSTLHIEIRDVLGRLAVAKKHSATTGENLITIDMQGQAPGVYFVTVNNGETKLVRKLLKE